MTSRLIEFCRGSSLVCLLVLSLALAVRGVGQVTPVELPKDVETNSFFMTVKVVDADTGKPLENSVVMVPMMSPAFGMKTTNEWRFPTDANGIATVRALGGVVVGNYFSLVVSNANYPMKSADWNAQSGSVRSVLPSEHTFRLERGGTIGGFVRDERGKPVEGVTVAPWGNGAASYRYDASQPKAREYSMLARDDRAGVVTDAKGFWLFANHPPDVTTLSLDVVRPDGSRSLFVTTIKAWEFQMNMGDPIELEALRATNAVLVIKDGVTIRGIVVDEAGKPIPNAVVKEREGSGWNVPMQQVTNDAQGRFALPHRTGAQYLLTAEADGYAVNSAIATVDAEMPEVKVVLPAARPVRLRVLGENGEPVAGAGVGVAEHRNRGHLMEWRGTTDLGGLVVWSSAPTQALSVHIATTNYAERMARLKPTSEEQVIRLHKELAKTAAVRLRVLDEQTGQPIASFPVWRELQQHLGFKDTGLVGTNGELKTEVNASDFQNGFSSTFRFQVRAEGYAPASTDQSYLDEGDFETTLLVRKSRPPAGVVLLPDGAPAADAKLMLNSGQGSVFMNSPENQYPGTGVISLKSGADGAFKFDGAEDGQRIVVIHPGGFASVKVEELRRAGKIPLQAWGRIEGVLKAGGKPQAMQQINIKSPVSWISLDSHHLVYWARTDAAGRFTFTNLPPGGYVLYRMPHPIMGIATTESHRLLLELAAGETKQVEYGFSGRTVVGRVDASGEVDWKNDPHLISVKLPPAPPNPNYNAFADPKEFEKARQAHGKSKAVLDYERKKQQFQLVFDKEGNFKVDDVPPGTYELSIRATKPNKGTGRNSYQRSEEVIGSLKRDITIPAGAAGEEFDLGTLEMEVKESLGAPSAPLDFSAEQLDGKPFKLVSLRGKPAVVVFWGMWAPGSLAKLESVQAAVAKLEADGRPALVTVNLDSSNEAAREGVKNLGTGWVRTRLSGEAMYEVTEQLSVDTLPMVLLLDAQGRVRGRDVDGKRLASSVKRLVANKN